MDSKTEFAYLVAALLFVLGLHQLRAPESGRRGVQLAALAMAIAVAGTLVGKHLVRYDWIIAGVLIGAAIGITMAVVIPMAKMPERIALSHAFGGLAAALVGIAEYARYGADLGAAKSAALGFEVLLGALTFTGSLAAFGKLQGAIAERPLRHRCQNSVNLALLAGALAAIAYLTLYAADLRVFFTMVAVAFLLGVSLVVPIGGADMPVVISLLNSYAGLAAAAAGFALSNTILIVCGALDGTSGFFLSLVMSKAMNRSFTNVVFGGFGGASAGATPDGRSGGALLSGATIGDALIALTSARSVIVVPGYGMAAARCQHALRELAELLEQRGLTVKYAIHPVAGRMPGHMNVLLAEANVPYDRLYDIDAINDEFAGTDVALVVGANDVVNPAAKHDPTSPIYGMPVLDAELARTVIVLKRSMSPGFAKIENELFLRPNTMILFGDANKTLTEMVRELKDAR